MGKLKKMALQTRLTAAVLAVMLLLTTLVAVIVPNLNTAEAADLPGTQAYYDARWEEAKVKAGNLAVGTAYTDYQGNAKTTTTEGPWMLDGLKAKYDAGEISAPWNGVEAGVVPTGGAGTVASPYEVTTAEQFRYCLVNHNSFKLMKDIDLGGYLGRNWTTPEASTNRWIADGNGHTVFNYYVNTSDTTLKLQSLFGGSSAKDTIIKNLRISNASSRSKASHVGILIAGINNILIEKCTVENSIVRGVAFISGLVCRAGIYGQDTNNWNTIDNCYVRNTYVYADTKISSSSEADFACAVQICSNAPANIYNTFAVDGDVISVAGHNSGFASCTFSFDVQNCFTNVDVYGYGDAAGFGGSVGGTFKNCYSSGKIEGMNYIGGFIGVVDRGAVIDSCYSTAMVGLSGQVKNAGGFIGSCGVSMVGGSDDSIVSTMNNCYAAGEVGSIETDSDIGRTTSQTVAGFMGYANSNTTTNNCYYDKQTTAMKEWASGASQNVSGIKGMLTTTSTKSGVGMTDANWTALGGAYNNSLGDGYYPQLTVFSNPTTFTNTNWMSQEELNNLIKAYSQASVSTVKLNTYDTDYAGNPLPTTTYDTVRDVTAKFPLTSDSNIAWARCGVTGSATLATGNGAKSNAFTEVGSSATSVIDLYQQGDTWYGDHPMPGVDWARVTATVGGQVGTRALRVCPRVGIEAGLSQTIGRGESYDHANDVQMVYSTGARMTDDNTKNDYTYGVYPDDPLESRQQQLLSASAFANLSALTTKYKQTGQNDAFSNVDALYMERTATDLATGVPTAATASGGKLNEVKIYEVLSENTDGSVVLGNQIDLTNQAQADKWNGNTAFATDSIHKIYSVQYVWSLADGRYVTDTKRIEYPKLTHNVSISVENVEGIKLSNKAFLDAYSVSTDDGKLDSSILPALGNNTKKEDWLIGQSHAHPAATSWKLDVGSEPMKEIKVTFHSIDGEVQRTVTVPAASLPQTAGVSASFEAIAPYRVYSYDSAGNLVWNTFEMKKTYNITLDSNGVYTIKFDKEFADYGDGVYVDDVDMNIDVVVVIDGEPPQKETVVFQFNNEREDKPWANGKSDVINDMPDLN